MADRRFYVDALRRLIASRPGSQDVVMSKQFARELAQFLESNRPGRYATDDEARDAAERMIQKHRKLLEKLADA